MSICFTIPGDAQGKGRPRFTKVGHAYTPEATRNYEAMIQLFARQAMHGQQMFVAGTGVALNMIVRVKAGKSWTQKKKKDVLLGNIPAITRTDADNVVKAIGDACNGIVYDDDKQICRIEFTRVYSTRSEVFVEFSEHKGALG